MHQSFVTTAPHLREWAGDSMANVWGSDLSSSPAVPGKCWACGIMQIYPHGIYYYKEQGYDSQQVPAIPCSGGGAVVTSITSRWPPWPSH